MTTFQPALQQQQCCATKINAFLELTVSSTVPFNKEEEGVGGVMSHW